MRMAMPTIHNAKLVFFHAAGPNQTITGGNKTSVNKAIVTAFRLRLTHMFMRFQPRALRGSLGAAYFKSLRISQTFDRNMAHPERLLWGLRPLGLANARLALKGDQIACGDLSNSRPSWFVVAKMILLALIFQPLSRPALTPNRHRSARKSIKRYVFSTVPSARNRVKFRARLFPRDKDTLWQKPSSSGHMN